MGRAYASYFYNWLPLQSHQSCFFRIAHNATPLAHVGTAMFRTQEPGDAILAIPVVYLRCLIAVLTFQFLVKILEFERQIASRFHIPALRTTVIAHMDGP